MGAFLLTINQDEKHLEDMSKRLGVERGHAILVALFLLHHTLEERDQGRSLSYTSDRTDELDKVKDAALKSIGKKPYTLNGDAPPPQE